jgi:hypothetical protein
MTIVAKFNSNKSQGILGEPDCEELWNNILRHIPDKLLVKPGIRILNIACGQGTEAVLLAKRMQNLGINKDAVNESFHLVDNSRIYANYVRGTYGFKNVYCEDFLTWNIDMKFDIVIGNPPFQEIKTDQSRKDQASNLWSKFWVRALECSTDTARVALITPVSWVSPSSDLKGKDCIHGLNRLWDVFNLYTSYANIQDVAAHFPGVGSSFGYVIVDKSGKSGLSFSNGVSTSLGFLPRSGFDQVERELDTVHNLSAQFTINQVNTPDLRVSIPLTRTLTPDSIEQLSGNQSPSQGSPKPELYLYVHVNTSQEQQQVHNRIISCISILNTHCRWSGFMNIKIVKMISWPKTR